MTNKEAIKYLQQLYPNGGHCWLDEQRIEAIGMAVNALQEEPVSEELEEAAFDYAEACKYDGGDKLLCVEHFKAGAEWQLNKIRKKYEENRD